MYSGFYVILTLIFYFHRKYFPYSLLRSVHLWWGATLGGFEFEVLMRQEIGTSDWKANLIFSLTFSPAPLFIQILSLLLLWQRTQWVWQAKATSSFWMGVKGSHFWRKTSSSVCLRRTFCRWWHWWWWTVWCEWMSCGWQRWFRARIKLIVPLAETYPH